MHVHIVPLLAFLHMYVCLYVCNQSINQINNSDMFQHGIMTKWFDPTFIPLLKAKGYSAVKRYCKVRRRDNTS